MTTLKSPSRDNMEIDTELVSPIRTHTRFSDRYKTLFQESPPNQLSNTEPFQKSPLVACSPKRTQSTTIKNEDRGQWREMNSPKKKKEEEQEEKEEEMTQDTPPKTTPKTTPKATPKAEPVETKKEPTATKPPKASKTPSPRASTPTTKSTPRYMMSTTSFRSKFDSKKQKESLGVRTSGKISKRQAPPSKIPKYKKQSNEDDELKRLSFQGNYVTMASRIKSFESELRSHNVKPEEGNQSNSRSASPSASIKTNAPKFKPFKFATSERAKKHSQHQKN